MPKRKSTGADHLKMTGKQGLERLAHFAGLVRDKQREARRTKDPKIEQEAFDLAKDYRDLRRAYSTQVRKQYKLDS